MMDMHSIVLANNDQCELIKVRFGEKQRYVIAPTLFTIFIVTGIDIIKDDLPPRIEIVYRTNSRLFNLCSSSLPNQNISEFID